MIEKRRLKNVVIFIQTVFKFCAVKKNYTVVTLKKMRRNQNWHLFWEYVKHNSKVRCRCTKIVQGKKSSNKSRRIFRWKMSTEYAKGCYLSLSQNVFCILRLHYLSRFRTYVKLKNLCLKAARSDDFIQEYNDVMAIYGSDFDENRIQVQLETLQEYCTNLYGNACIRSTDTLKVQSHLTEALKLTKLILVQPATNNMSERTFNLLKLIKSFFTIGNKVG